MDNKDKGLTCLGATAAVLIALVASIAINGFVLERLWEWFVVPLGAPPITFVHALGIAILFGAFGLTKAPNVDKEKASWGKATTSILTPLMLLGLGWILYQFM